MAGSETTKDDFQDAAAPNKVTLLLPVDADVAAYFWGDSEPANWQEHMNGVLRFYMETNRAIVAQATATLPHDADITDEIVRSYTGENLRTQADIAAEKARTETAYRVDWQIDVHAGSPEAAAIKASDYMRRAQVFQVTDRDGHAVEIDLADAGTNQRRESNPAPVPR